MAGTTSPRVRRIRGTREWAATNFNVLLGCPHDCRYCYARAMALRFKRIARAEDWRRPKPIERNLKAKIGKRKGRVMFPSAHDVTPEFLDPCIAAIEKILAAGNRLLIVSKPHLACVRAICGDFQGFRDQILFRFTIGARDDRLLSYWEPGAPDFWERRACLRYAHDCGFQTSVSIEPLLETAAIGELIGTLWPLVTETIWIGKLNRLRARVIAGTDEEAIGRVEAGQTDAAIWAVYQALKDDPKIRWKDSYREAIQRVVAGGQWGVWK